MPRPRRLRPDPSRADDLPSPRGAATGHAATGPSLVTRAARRTVRWMLIAVVQRVASVAILSLVVARLAASATSDRFFMGLGIVEGIGTIVPVGFMAIVTPRLMARAATDRPAALALAGTLARRIGGTTALLTIALALLAALFSTRLGPTSAFAVPPAALAFFTLAALGLALTARDAALSQLLERAEYLVLAPLSGNVVTLAVLALWRGGPPLTGAAFAVAAGALTHWGLLRWLIAGRRPAWLRSAASAPATSSTGGTRADDDALRLLGWVLVAGGVQGAASLLVVLARAIAGGETGAVTDVSLALRIALLPPGLLAYPAWLATAPLLARPDIPQAERSRLLTDGLVLLLLAIGVVGGGMAGAAAPLVTLFFGLGGLDAAAIDRTAATLACALPLALSAAGFVFLGGPYQATARVGRLAAWVGAGLLLSAALATAFVALSVGDRLPPAARVVAGLAVGQLALLPFVVRDVRDGPGGFSPSVLRIAQALLAALVAVGVGWWAGTEVSAWAMSFGPRVSPDDVTAGPLPRLARDLLVGGTAGALAALAVVALLGGGRRSRPASTSLLSAHGIQDLHPDG